jgi:hypothetical protein
VKRRLGQIQVSLNLPFGLGGISGTWEPSEEERTAAWEMYVELITRVSVEQLGPGQGSLREALSSLYSLFDTTRDILRKYGPDVASPQKEDRLSFGHLAVQVLNRGLRPFLTKWHPALSDYEARRPQDVSPIDHERRWREATELRAELAELRELLRGYATALEQAAGVPSLAGPGGARAEGTS